MEKYSIDILCAYARLGLTPGASLAEIRAVLANAVAYRFFTKTRIEGVRFYVMFFEAREKLGGFLLDFAAIKKAYHRMAMDLHPDRHAGDKGSEERFKEISAAYDLVNDMHDQARLYFEQPEAARLKGEQKAREATQSERAGARPPDAATPDESAQPAKAAPSERKYMSASVPRSIRTKRLSYLPLHTIIGSKVTKKENDLNLIFDYIMLPEDQFLRAKSYLAVPNMGTPDLQPGQFAPPYILKDVKELIVPAGQSEPEAFAKEHFRKLFNL